MLEVCEVSKIYDGPDGEEIVAVDGVTFTVDEGETLSLIGTSGCGKTTTLRLVNRLIEPTSGRICVDGHDVRVFDPITLRRCMGYVIQSGGLFPHMTVAENVGVLCELEGWPDAKRRDRVAELLGLVNLPVEEYAKRYPRELSGGQRQRVGVARALALDPPYLLMDEPFGALDPITRRQLQLDFRELEGSVHKTVLFVTHDLEEAFAVGDRVALMRDGAVVQVGTRRDFAERPADAFVKGFVNGGDTVDAS